MNPIFFAPCSPVGWGAFKKNKMNKTIKASEIIVSQNATERNAQKIKVTFSIPSVTEGEEFITTFLSVIQANDLAGRIKRITS